LSPIAVYYCTATTAKVEISRREKKVRASQPDVDLEISVSVTSGGTTKEELRQKRNGRRGRQREEGKGGQEEREEHKEVLLVLIF